MGNLGDRIKSAGAQLSNAAPDMIPGWLLTAGIGGWLIVGIAATLGLIGWFFAVSASISVPLILALVIGMVAYPICEWMTDRGVPKSLAAGIVLILLGAIMVGVVWLTLTGVVSQFANIQVLLQGALAELNVYLVQFGLDPIDTNSISSWFTQASAADTGGPLTTKLLASFGSVLTAGLSGTFSFFFGIFISATLLYYVLSDFPVVAHWLGGHMAGLPVEIGEGIIDDAVQAMRGYFKANTISGFIVAVVIGLTMVALDVPLAVPVALVTFLTVYIPFFGAIFSGAFGFVVALGSNGLGAALILLVVILLAQNVLQTVINARVMGDELNLHPLVVLVVTMLGSIFGGLLGAALGAPVAALFMSASKRLSVAFRSQSTDEVAA